MVKGISRRVVVVDSPDQRFFEQAIFIVRNDAGRRGRHRPGAGGGGPPGGAKLCRRRPWAVQPDLAGSFPGGLHPDGRCRDRLGVADGVADLENSAESDSGLRAVSWRIKGQGRWGPRLRNRSGWRLHPTGSGPAGRPGSRSAPPGADAHKTPAAAVYRTGPPGSPGDRPPL